ncbi:MAG TPA: type IV pilin N-terminal domain-containing protein [Thermoplasmata archaeon]|nr:type IV pilin N-terminal domain-containing protein [Thermoplasmata archaeon]
MNVWGHNERSWRKARKRAVSPIIATILLVAITVVLAAVLYVLISGLTHGPGSTPIGSAFAAGNVRSGTCASGTVATTGCKSGDFVETLTIEQSTVTFGSVLFEVISQSTGNAYACPTGTSNCAFSIVNTGGTAVAWTANIAGGAALVMTAGFPTANYGGGTSSGSSLSAGLYTITIDLNTGGATGQGIAFVVIGQGSYSGTTAAVSLL